MKRPFECKYEDCDKKFTTRFSLRRHVSTHAPAKTFTCNICFKQFALGQYLKEHTYIHTGQKPFKCPFEGCTKAFRQAGKLSLHKKFHQNKLFIVKKVKRTPTGPIIAELNDKRLSSSSLLKVISQLSSTTSERSIESDEDSDMSCSSDQNIDSSLADNVSSELHENKSSNDIPHGLEPANNTDENEI